MKNLLKVVSFFILFNTTIALANCQLEARWAGFVIHSRGSNTPVEIVSNLANLSYPKNEYPLMNKRSLQITYDIYNWNIKKINRYKPFQKAQLIKAEKDYERFCMSR